MKFESDFTLSNGTTIHLKEPDMRQISKHYERLLTQELLLDNYPYLTEEEAWSYACEVRRCMDKYDTTEEWEISELGLTPPIDNSSNGKNSARKHPYSYLIHYTYYDAGFDNTDPDTIDNTYFSLMSDSPFSQEQITNLLKKSSAIMSSIFCEELYKDKNGTYYSEGEPLNPESDAELISQYKKYHNCVEGSNIYSVLAVFQEMVKPAVVATPKDIDSVNTENFYDISTD